MKMMNPQYRHAKDRTIGLERQIAAEARAAKCDNCKRARCVCRDPAGMAKTLTPTMRGIMRGHRPHGMAQHGSWEGAWKALYRRGIVTQLYGELTEFGRAVLQHLPGRKVTTKEPQP